MFRLPLRVAVGRAVSIYIRLAPSPVRQRMVERESHQDGMMLSTRRESVITPKTDFHLHLQVDTPTQLGGREGS